MFAGDIPHRIQEVEIPIRVTHLPWLGSYVPLKRWRGPEGNRPSEWRLGPQPPPPEQRTVRMITVAVPASAVDKGSRGRCSGWARLVCGSGGCLLPDALIANDI